MKKFNKASHYHQNDSIRLTNLVLTKKRCIVATNRLSYVTKPGHRCSETEQSNSVFSAGDNSVLYSNKILLLSFGVITYFFWSITIIIYDILKPLLVKSCVRLITIQFQSEKG